MRQGVGTLLSTGMITFFLKGKSNVINVEFFSDGNIYHGEFWGNMRHGKGQVGFLFCVYFVSMNSLTKMVHYYLFVIGSTRRRYDLQGHLE